MSNCEFKTLAASLAMAVGLLGHPGVLKASRPPTSAGQAKPNIVIILADDQGYPDMGCHGNPLIQTPNMNRLARSSVRFHDFHVKTLWAIEGETSGRFRFEVRRWPHEVSVPMTAGLPPAHDPDIEYIGHESWRIDVPGAALDIAEVQLQLSNQPPLTKEVSAGVQGVTFDVDLKPGPLDLQAWLIDSTGQRTGAYYVYAEQLE